MNDAHIHKSAYEYIPTPKNRMMRNRGTKTHEDGTSLLGLYLVPAVTGKGRSLLKHSEWIY
jgi:hypothetical protein